MTIFFFDKKKDTKTNCHAARDVSQKFKQAGLFTVGRQHEKLANSDSC